MATIPSLFLLSGMSVLFRAGVLGQLSITRELKRRELETSFTGRKVSKDPWPELRLVSAARGSKKPLYPF